MRTCKEISKLVSESLDRELPFRERMAVRVHLMMCSMCRTYQKQTLQLQTMFQAAARREPTEPLSDEATKRIKEALKTAGK